MIRLFLQRKLRIHSRRRKMEGFSMQLESITSWKLSSPPSLINPIMPNLPVSANSNVLKVEGESNALIIFCTPDPTCLRAQWHWLNVEIKGFFLTFFFCFFLIQYPKNVWLRFEYLEFGSYLNDENGWKRREKKLVKLNSYGERKPIQNYLIMIKQMNKNRNLPPQEIFNKKKSLW